MNIVQRVAAKAQKKKLLNDAQYKALKELVLIGEDLLDADDEGDAAKIKALESKQDKARDKAESLGVGKALGKDVRNHAAMGDAFVSERELRRRK